MTTVSEAVAPAAVGSTRRGAWFAAILAGAAAGSLVSGLLSLCLGVDRPLRRLAVGAAIGALASLGAWGRRATVWRAVAVGAGAELVVLGGMVWSATRGHAMQFPDARDCMLMCLFPAGGALCGLVAYLGARAARRKPIWRVVLAELAAYSLAVGLLMAAGRFVVRPRLEAEHARLVASLLDEALAHGRDPEVRAAVLWAKQHCRSVLPARERVRHQCPTIALALTGSEVACYREFDDDNTDWCGGFYDVRHDLIVVPAAIWLRDEWADVLVHECLHAYRYHYLPAARRRYVTGDGGDLEQLIVTRAVARDVALQVGVPYRRARAVFVARLRQAYAASGVPVGDAPYPAGLLNAEMASRAVVEAKVPRALAYRCVVHLTVDGFRALVERDGPRDPRRRLLLECTFVQILGLPPEAFDGGRIP